MYLSDEYLKRHQIKKVVKARYCKEGYLLFKKKDDLNAVQSWRILKIIWSSQSRNPGAYDIEFLKPIHDGYRYAVYFDSSFRKFFKWEEYEENLFKIVKQMKDFEIVFDSRYVFLDFWKIFVLVFDSWFSDQSFEVQNLLFGTLDPDLDLEQKYKNLEKFLKVLENKSSWVYNHWCKNILNCTENYAYWACEIK